MITTKASRKLIGEWKDTCKVGIYDNCTWSIRLYEDRAIYRYPAVRWIGNTGGYHGYMHRITGSALEALLALAEEQAQDDTDYTDEALRIASRAVDY